MTDRCQSKECQRLHWPEHKKTCTDTIPEPEREWLVPILRGAEKFALKYQKEATASTLVGFQAVKGWTETLETTEKFRERFHITSRNFAWELTIRLKSTSDWTDVLHHWDFAYVPGSGKLVDSRRYGSNEAREAILKNYEADGKVGLVTLFQVEVAEGICPWYFTRLHSMDVNALLVPYLGNAEAALIQCQQLV